MRLYLAITLLFVSMALGLAGGCTLLHPTSTPAIFDSSRAPVDRLVSGERLYTATINELTALRKAGVISDDEQRQIAGIRKQAAIAFDQGHLFADANDTQNAQAQLDIIQGLLNDLTARVAKAKGGSK